MPVGMQFSTEVARPTPEGTSNGLVQLCGQVSVVFVYLMQAMRGRSGGFALSLLVSGLLVAAAAALVPFMREVEGQGSVAETGGS
jgi:hypothetical protein